jgi:hypothetical protein
MGVYGEYKVKPPQGEVIFVKVCIPEVGRLIFPLGLKFRAMLPCGNLGIYQNGGKTEISMLHPRSMGVTSHFPSPLFVTRRQVNVEHGPTVVITHNSAIAGMADREPWVKAYPRDVRTWPTFTV